MSSLIEAMIQMFAWEVTEVEILVKPCLQVVKLPSEFRSVDTPADVLCRRKASRSCITCHVCVESLPVSFKPSGSGYSMYLFCMQRSASGPGRASGGSSV